MDKRVFFPLLLLLYICMGLAACHKSEDQQQTVESTAAQVSIFKVQPQSVNFSVIALIEDEITSLPSFIRF